jgi:uncharacterized membrane protein SpoIIM required for sporulation
MNVAKLIASREDQWQELEKLCSLRRADLKKDPDQLIRFSELYRGACADLALAESYQLPPQTVDYLHRLVAVAHNQLYRSSRLQWHHWYRVIFEDTPRAIFNEPCVHFCFVVFWGFFLAAAWLAYEDAIWPDFANEVVGKQNLETFEEMYGGFNGRGFGGNSLMTGFYIFNNAGIGLSCFVSMLLLLPGLVTLSYNAVHLGAVFGYMFRPDLGDASVHFKTFVTAHGPIELTAIVLSAGAGLKIGMSWLITGGLSRLDSLYQTARESLPLAMSAVILFCLAALIEGFISPIPEDYVPWWIKGAISVFTSLILMFYFVVLGYPRD